MVNIQVRDVSVQVRDALTEVAQARGQSMQAYLKALLEQEARRARNGALLREVRNLGGGCVTEDEETVQELQALRAQRDAHNAGAA